MCASVHPAPVPAVWDDGVAARSEDYAPVSDYAAIGDCHGIALVRRDASIDWACLLRFDSGGVFCRLLDAVRGGAFELAPREAFTCARRYLPDTNVLETTFTTESGAVARVLDCFAMRKGGRRRPLRQLIRRVEGRKGRVVFDVTIRPRFDYASLHPWLREHPNRVFSAVGGDEALVLHTDCPITIDRETTAWRGAFEISPRQRVRFALTASVPHAVSLTRGTARVIDARLDATTKWWRRWSKRTRRSGIRDPAVLRSALVLKLLTCAPTGAIVAAATTSLPEEIGGERNWDYRYSWIRDATMTLSALFATGHPEVATSFKRFIETATAGRPEELQIMYGCYGARRLPELTISSLEGYRGSRPVRAGNAAAAQVQLDVYGEILEAARLWRNAGSATTADGWRFLRGLVDVATVRWQEPDQGLWEMRGPPRHFVYSKAMCWLAVSRGIELAKEDGLDADLDTWCAARDEIRRSILAHGVDPVRRCFVQSYGSTELDASLLRLPMMGFVDAADLRMRATVDLIRRELGVGPLIRRYRNEHVSDGCRGGEGMFLMASFWLVDVLAMDGRLDEAQALYDQLLPLANDVGLFAEEYDPVAREQLGNFPQAFTHIAQITSAEHLRRARGGLSPHGPLSGRVGPESGAGSTSHHECDGRASRRVAGSAG